MKIEAYVLSPSWSENHVVVGELLESKSTQNADMNTAQSMIDVNWNPDSEASQVAGGFSIGSSMSVLQVASCILIFAPSAKYKVSKHQISVS